MARNTSLIKYINIRNNTHKKKLCEKNKCPKVIKEWKTEFNDL